MKKKNELSYRDLKMTCDTNLFHFETTEELEPISTGIGQDRGIKAYFGACFRYFCDTGI